MKKHIGTITIFSDDRHNNAAKLQEVLTKNGNLIRSRLGVNLSPLCSSACPGVIVLIVEGTKAQINSLTKKIDAIYAVKAKNVVIN
jgi:metal-responsive CopG/Arc/MetJ family transcriptional regulator